MDRHAVALASALLLAATVVRAAAPEPAERQGNKLVVYHAWASPSETAALGALVEVFKRAYPDVSVRTAAVDGRGMMFTIVRDGQSDCFATQAGSTLQPFLDAGSVSDLDAVWASEDLDKVLPPVLRKINRRDGHHYSLPITVHRDNLIWYNKSVLDKYRIEPTTLTTWDAFLKAAETLRASGMRNPIQMGLTWTATEVFEGIMAGLGRSAYEDWINGRVRAADDPRSVEAFTIFKKYLQYVNEDHATTAWDGALRRVITGQSAFIVMGDWADGEFRIGGMKYGKDYGAIPVPATQGMYGLVVDSFARPRQRPHDPNGDRWLKVAASREGQDAFSSVKGSISPRTDADAAKYGPYQRSALADLKAARLIYPSHDIVAPEPFKVRQTEVIAAFTVDRDVKKAAAALAAAAVQAEKHFKEAWSLAQP
jgi:glucose/mannose transport system substrate-binding protein